MALIVGQNCKLEVAKTYGNPVTVSAIALDANGTVTATAHGFVVGDIVLFNIGSGMPELNGQVARVTTVPTANSFTIAQDTTGLTAFASGSVRRITAWDVADKATAINGGNVQPNRIEVTTLLDKDRQYIFGAADSPSIDVSAQFDPTAVATATVRAASKSNAFIPIRVTFASGQVGIVNAYASAGDGFQIGVGQVATTTWNFTAVKNWFWF